MAARLTDRVSLCKERGNMLVLGEGVQPSVGMVIGEAPNRTEVKLGRPFVGRSGELLDRAFGELGVDRATLYITNVCKELPLTAEGKLRPPYEYEVAAWGPTLLGEIGQTQPKAILALGQTASGALAGIANVTHVWHPAYVLRQGGEKSDAYSLWLQKIDPWAAVVLSNSLCGRLVDKVPTQPFMAVVRPLVERQAQVYSDEWLGRRLGVRGDSLNNALKSPTIDFDLADLILCKLGAVHVWWGELGEIYWNLDLHDDNDCERECALPECKNVFRVYGRIMHKMCCSKACNDKRWRLNAAA